MDSLSVLSVIASIVSFLDLGTKVLSSGRSIYTSKDATVKLDVNLQQATTELEEACEALGSHGQKIPNLASDCSQLRKLALRCKTLAEELLELLEELKVDRKRSHFQNLSQSAQFASKKNNIVEHQKILDDHRVYLLGRISTLLRDETSQIHRLLEDISKQHAEHNIPGALQTDLLRRQILHELENLRSSKDCRKDLLELCALVRNLQAEARNALRYLAVLRGLSYQCVWDRDESIADAHPRTFEWILSPGVSSNVRFIEWLEFQNGTYWVTGKTGSGKSTLMKHLAKNPEVRLTLKKWAEEKSLFVGSYFLLKSGHGIQSEQEGLLKLILYDIFRQAPNLISKVCRSRINALTSSVAEEPWDMGELRLTFSALKSQSIDCARVCLFIDGLDEYEGEYDEIIKIVHDLVSSPDIKVCASSRPWDVFKNHFGQNAHNMLMLHDFTQNDIKTYVLDELRDHSPIASRHERNSRFQEVLEDIIDRAQGVFLWVYLVTRSLIRGLHEGDTLTDFQESLWELPTELEDYFRYMLDSVEPEYHSDSARILLYCLESEHSPSLITLSYFNELEEQFSLSLPAWSSHSLLKLKHEEAAINLHTLCPDLLEINMGSKRKSLYLEPEGIEELILAPKVEFLHRTVRDFLAQPSTRQLLRSRLNKPVNVNLYFCNALLCQISTVRLLSARTESRVALPMLVKDFMRYAARIEQSEKRTETKLLNKLEMEISGPMIVLLQSLVRREQQLDASDHWLKILAVQSDLYLYVTDFLRKRSRTSPRISSHPILDFALRLPFDQNAPRKIDLRMVSALLEAGADPNEVVPFTTSVESRTVWQLFLSSRWNYKEFHGYTVDELKANTQIFGALLSRGADPEAIIYVISGLLDQRTAISAIEVMNQVCSLEDLDALNITAYQKPGLLSRIRKKVPIIGPAPRV